MTSMSATITRSTQHARPGLRDHVDRSAKRGLILSTLGGLLLAVGCFVSGVVLLGAVDAIADLQAGQRGVGLFFIVLLTFAAGYWFACRPWQKAGRTLTTAEHIEAAAGVGGQPLVCSLSMMEGSNDALSNALVERAEQHAAELVGSVSPRCTYPLSMLQKQGRWLWLALVGVIVFAVLFPAQAPGQLARVFLPWSDTPAFSLTQLEPIWTPTKPVAGDDVRVEVLPSGVMPDAVDFVRVNVQGDEVERFAMVPEGRNVFTHVLGRVDQAILFKLEVNGRATRMYTIDLAPGDPGSSDQQKQSDIDRSDQDPGGTTHYDPEAVAARDASVAADWADLRDQIDDLLAGLAQAEAHAQSIDPSDTHGITTLAEQIAALSAQAADLSASLRALQGELPPDAAASLAALQDALSSMQASQLPVTPGSPSQANDRESESADWLGEAGEAAGADQRRIARGLGASRVPSENGIASGDPGDGSPIFKDPQARGGYDERVGSGDDGPLPDAVMQQVPPRYRPLVTAYFNRLAQPNPEPDETP